MNFKILCSDLDGTLLSTKNNVSDFAVSEISRIKEAIRVILVSARMPKSMIYLQQRLDIQNQPIICYNGALVLHGSNEISSTFIDMEYIEGIYGLAEEYAVKLGLYHKNEWYVEKTSERVQKEIRDTKATPHIRDTRTTLEDWTQRNIGAHKIMTMGTKESTDQLYPLLQKKFGLHLHLYRSNDTLIEVAPKSVSKLSAIKLLLQNQEGLKDIIAFGDNYNDLEMLQYVGFGVAVENAREEVKAVADQITLKNTEDGVAKFIKQHIVI